MNWKLIGKGNTAEIFDIGNKKVVKLFKNGYPLESVQNEFENSKLVNEVNSHIIKSYKLIEYSGRYGIVYDKIEGISMLDLLLDTQDVVKYTKVLARLHKMVLSQKTESATSFKSIIKKNIKRTDKISINCKLELISTLESLPEDNCLCHGDFHPGNIMVSSNKYYIIDYMNVCRGHKYGDIARTVYLIEMTPVPPEIHDKDQVLYMKKQIVNVYLKEMGVSREDLSDWLLVITAARLSELTNEQVEETNSILEYLLMRKNK